MKKLRLLFILPLLLLACDSSDDNSEDVTSFEELILGKWIVEYQWEGPPKESNEDYINLPQTEPDNTTDYTGQSEVTTFQFLDDGMVFISEWGESSTKEYYIDGNNIFFSPSQPSGVWLNWKIYDIKENYLVARKSCFNNICDDPEVEVRYYRKTEN